MIERALIETMITAELPSLVETYRQIHANPELSHFEQETAQLFGDDLLSRGYQVERNIGKYEREDWKGHGVVGQLVNGVGPTVLVRADMDALPIEEATELPYSSNKRVVMPDGRNVGVMHACGHDIHVTCTIGVARILAKLKHAWNGTLLVVGQPAEETLDGARAMLRDSLFERVSKPNYALALHTYPQLDAGTVGIVPGYFLASANSIDITVRGKGGHGSAPQLARDPILLAAQIVLALQTIVSREISPHDAAVLSVGSIHGGSRYNIIPDEVHLQLSVRAYKDEVRHKVLESIERICLGVALAAGLSGDLLPIVKVNEGEYAPATYNDPLLTERLSTVFKQQLGPENVIAISPLMASEDFGLFGLENREIPTCMFFVGANNTDIPGKTEEQFLHSSSYSPDAERTIRTGVLAMSLAALALLGSQE